MSSTDWENATLHNTYVKARAALLQRRAAEPGFGIQEMKGILEHLYIQEGLDQYGRGRLHDLAIQATIAAHEDLLAEWTARQQP
ncbi:MAG: hypothetical protein A2087_10375 [Spirochaetes bacterium GWD1_61_31]|nr:MAG: hypothetical protein A2Y37_12140 [Spirochaetes bacterium GWB1_60_80]OHD30192.1 MAG: hypothetical protein A2004_14000 [Spirochaetes bacterium GWC1_61_12]OHD34620.1 MAG: hypothetical protein A2087_10375 [Spirochaetes bacterium GWD1_61_31]OHD46436.1 MAG: hypothetical protein A2Y35_10280 [Spirochaetes bacterium GWE1_60_18]OHD59534.1 MAG: hypothetical protein A2Y32_10235 [Spirochaetes bacterium GWF1_60_12]HAW85814.1 hypothetical protein [Spirochaetaceae bacterium]